MYEPLVKVYGYIEPVNGIIFEAMRAAAILMGQEANEAFSLVGTKVLIGYEGVYFPVDEVLNALEPFLREGLTGRIDYIDLEKWSLHRYRLSLGEVRHAQHPLNDILSYAEH